MSRDVTAFETPAGVVLTCCHCGRTYKPSETDLEAGRTDYPDRDCGAWAFRAQQPELSTPNAHPSNKECLP